ncbi:hypothetical protein HON52_01090 [Candidatus Uhrbacteria bacterium]|nr:hypothetical protein [Candidatus Uhrbacteria bacterium]
MNYLALILMTASGAALGGLVVGSIVHAVMTRRMREFSKYIAKLSSDAGWHKSAATAEALACNWVDAANSATQYFEVLLIINLHLKRQSSSKYPTVHPNVCAERALEWVREAETHGASVANRVKEYLPEI